MLTPTPSTPLPPSSGQSLSPPTSGTFGWARGPERDAGGEIVAQILPAYPRVGDDGQALARSVFCDAGLLIGCLGAALEEHQIQEEFCGDRSRPGWGQGSRVIEGGCASRRCRGGPWAAEVGAAPGISGSGLLSLYTERR